MKRKPKCFISSSFEDLGVAREIASFLSSTNNIEVITWTDSTLNVGLPILENFRGLASIADFFIILVPAEQNIPREMLNYVFFELGYLIATGKPVLTLFEKGYRSSRPSDLGGILYLEYERENINNIFHYLQKWTSKLVEA